MKAIENQEITFSILVRIVYFGMLLFLLLFPTFHASGQPVKRSEQFQRKQVREIFTSQIGIRETQPNSGPQIEEFLRYVNLPKGNPWCAAFVCWTYGRANVPNPRTGWSPDLFLGSKVIWERGERGKVKAEGGVSSIKYQVSGFPQDAPYDYPPSLVTRNSLLAPNKRLTAPKTGDVFGIYFPEKGRIAHAGFIDEWKDPWVVTVEGNTNILGSREGDGVYRKRRLVRSVYKVARYVN